MNRTETRKRVMPITRLLFLVILLGVVVSGAGQDMVVVRDLRLWTGVNVEKRFAKDWTVSLGEELRFKHDISELNYHFTEAGLRYRINKNFALEGQYRITWDKKKDESFEILTRYALDLRYKGRLDFITIMYRLRYQKEVLGWNLIGADIPYEKYVRNRIVLRYEEMFKIKPYLSAEIFQLFLPDKYPEFEYYRVLGGIRYKAGKLGEFDAAYGFNRKINSPQTIMLYTIKLNYTYSF